MDKGNSAKFTINTGTDLAFALVVFISFFTTFSSASVRNPFLISVIIILGIAYITTGIYGFSYTVKKDSTKAKLFYFIAQLFIGGLIVFYGKGAGFNALILLPLVAHTAMLLDQDWMLTANIGIIVTFVISVFSYSRDLHVVWNAAPIFFAGQVFILIFTQMAVTEQKARVKMEKLAQELSEANKHLSEYAIKVRGMAITQERNRMAREIHDGLGHYLTTINMQIKAISAIIGKDNQKAKDLLINAQKLSSDALVDVRNSVFALRQDLSEIPSLFDRIKEIAQNTSSSERKIVVKQKGNPYEISPQVDLTIFRAAQETINNANKHSKSSNVLVEIDYSNNDEIILTTSDNGIGSSDMDKGFGILGIKERVRLLDGKTEINTNPGDGFLIKIVIPRKNDNKDINS